MRKFGGTWPYYTTECQSDVLELLKRGGPLSGYRSNRSWGVGPREGSWAYRFERALESKFKVKHAVAVNSGTMALTAAILSLGLPKGEIITTPFSFSATPASIIHAGHIPVFVDVDPYEFNVTSENIKKAITKRTRAITPVDLFGGIADYKRISSLGFPVIRDGCQSVGAMDGGVFHFGKVTCCSGNGGKNCPCGEGGWALTNDSRLAKKIRLYISHAENFGTKWVGVNGRMPELTACVAYHGLLKLEERNNHRTMLASMLWWEWAKNPNWSFIESIPLPHHLKYHSLYVYPIVLRDGVSRDQFIRHMKHCGVDVGAGYITPTLERYAAFEKYKRGPLPVVRKLSSKTLCILSCVNPSTTRDRIMQIAKYIGEFRP